MRWVLNHYKTDHALGAYQLRHVRPVIIQAALDSAGVSADMRKRPTTGDGTVTPVIEPGVLSDPAFF